MAFCTQCRGVMPMLAAVCPHCGYDFGAPAPSAPVSKRERAIQIATTILCVVLFTFACVRPVYWAKGGLSENGEMTGLVMLVLGGLFCVPPWFANVTFVVGLIGLWVGRLQRALAAATIGFLFALTPLWKFGIPTDNFQLRDGYVLWVAAMAALLAGSVGAVLVRCRA